MCLCQWGMKGGQQKYTKRYLHHELASTVARVCKSMSACSRCRPLQVCWSLMTSYFFMRWRFIVKSCNHIKVILINSYQLSGATSVKDYALSSILSSFSTSFHASWSVFSTQPRVQPLRDSRILNGCFVFPNTHSVLAWVTEGCVHLCCTSRLLDFPSDPPPHVAQIDLKCKQAFPTLPSSGHVSLWRILLPGGHICRSHQHFFLNILHFLQSVCPLQCVFVLEADESVKIPIVRTCITSVRKMASLWLSLKVLFPFWKENIVTLKIQFPQVFTQSPDFFPPLINNSEVSATIQ